jgi:hypothetical protein
MTRRRRTTYLLLGAGGWLALGTVVAILGSLDDAWWVLAFGLIGCLIVGLVVLWRPPRRVISKPGSLFNTYANAYHEPSSAEIAPAKNTPATRRRRQRIPEPIRHEVWRRDQGRCVDCGSTERLEYDHIIAVEHGGSTTAGNIELRCELCRLPRSYWTDVM